MRKRNPMLLADFYKTIHHLCYVPGMDYLVSYWTPRMSRMEGIDKVVMFGLQGFLKEYLVDMFNENFFNRPKEEVMAEYKRIITHTMSAPVAGTEHLEELYDLGYLPIRIKAVPEGTRVNLKTPMFEISNTVKGFGYLVNYIETLTSVNVWHEMTSASKAYQYRELVHTYFEKTVSDKATHIVLPKAEGGYLHHPSNGPITLPVAENAACGDFSMRGMAAVESAEKSSAGHLLSFTGSATIPAVMWLEDYYNCNIEKEVVGKGVPSTEHSVMSSYGRDGEFECYRRLISGEIPQLAKGPLSIVSDTYDYWNVLTNFIPRLKEQILARDGKILVRGDSGDPVDIICGEITEEHKLETLAGFEGLKRSRAVDKPKEVFVKEDGNYYRWIGPGQYDWVCLGNEASPAGKGTVEILWELFGGYINDKGYKVLDPHIGTIYGDSITIERAAAIYARLTAKGFAVDNAKLGIGSYTYQYVTRDSLGFALKATHSVVNGADRQIFKDPVTDTGNFKKSQRGMCYLYKDGEDVLYKDGLTMEEVANMPGNLLETVYEDSKVVKEYSLKEIRDRLHNGKF